jgi:hypothetical protein
VTEAATPLFNLLVTVFLSGFRFVQALQRTVVTLVQFPGFLNRQPGLIQFVQHVPQGVDGTFQHRGISKIKAEAFLQQFTCRFASLTPFSDRSTSYQPVKRFSLFHWLSP